MKKVLNFNTGRKTAALIMTFLLALSMGLSGCTKNPDDETKSNDSPVVEKTKENAAAEKNQISTDPLGYLTSQTEDLTKSIVDNARQSSLSFKQGYNIVAGENAAGIIDMAFSMRMGETAFDTVISTFPELSAQKGLLKLLLDSGVTSQIAIDFTQDFLMAFNMGWTLQGDEVLSAGAVLNGTTLHAGIPALYNKYVTADLIEFGFNPDEILAELSNMQGSLDSLGLDEELGSAFALLELIGDRETVIDSLTSDLIKAAFPEIKDIKFNENVNALVNKTNLTYNEIAITLTEKEFYNIVTAALVTVKSKDDYINLFVDIMNIMDEWSFYDRDIMVSAIDDLIAELANEEPGNETLKVSVYLDEKDNAIKGVNMNVEDMLMGAIFDLSNGYDMYFIGDDEEYRIRGELKGTEENFSGDMWIESKRDNISIHLMDFTIKSDKNNLDYLDAVITAKLGNFLDLAEEDLSIYIPDSVADYLYTAEIIMTLASNKQEMDMTLEFANRGTDISAKLALSARETVPAGIFVLPEDIQTVSVAELETVVQNEILTLLANFTTITEKIESKGYDISFINDMLMSLF